MKYKLLAFVLVIALLASCSATRTSKKHLQGVEAMLAKHQYGAVMQKIEAVKGDAYTKKDRVVYWLDMGMLHHYNGDWALSNELLTQAEQGIEELYTKSVGRAAASFLLNDNVNEYPGEDYEDIYINVFKCLNYMHLNNDEAAFVEVRRINDKLKVLEQKYDALIAQYQNNKDAKNEIKKGTTEFNNSALGRYLSMLLYRSDKDWDGARIDLDKIRQAYDLAPKVYTNQMPDFSKCLDKTNQARLNIVSFTGLGPDKVANTLWIHTEKNSIYIAAAKEQKGKQKLQELDRIAWPGVEENYHFKFQLPEIKPRKSKIQSAKVLVDSVVVGQLALLENVDNVAKETFKVKQPIIYAKTIARVVTKGVLAAIAKKKAKEEINKKNDGIGGALLGALAGAAIDVGMDALENADLRLGRFFPKNAYVGEFEVAPGKHRVAVQYYGANNALLWTNNLGEKDLQPGKLNTVESFYLY